MSFAPTPGSNFEGLVHEAIGYASMAWTEGTKGVFKEREARDAAEAIIDSARDARAQVTRERDQARLRAKNLSEMNQRVIQDNKELARMIAVGNEKLSAVLTQEKKQAFLEEGPHALDPDRESEPAQIERVPRSDKEIRLIAVQLSGSSRMRVAHAFLTDARPEGLEQRITALQLAHGVVTDARSILDFLEGEEIVTSIDNE